MSAVPRGPGTREPSTAREADEADAFKEALVGGAKLAKCERLILCTFKEDPAIATGACWRPIARRAEERIDFERDANGYICQSTFMADSGGVYRRRTSQFCQGLACMVDDIGTKLPIGLMRRLTPSAIVETSRANFQAWYFFRPPLKDPQRLGDFIRAFFRAHAPSAKDPGMAGVNRVGRLPGFLNTKSSAKDWRVRTRHLDPGKRYTLDELSDAFGLTLCAATEVRTARPPDDERANRSAEFSKLLDRFKSFGMFKGERSLDGATQIYDVACPWLEDHTGRIDSGAVLFSPSDENGWWGGFHCFHGHCVDSRGIRDVADWVAEQDVRAVDLADSLGGRSSSR